MASCRHASHTHPLRPARDVTVTAEHRDSTERERRPADVIVVSVDDTVQLVVDGAPTPESEHLVQEMRKSFVETGWAAEDVAVVWRTR